MDSEDFEIVAEITFTPTADGGRGIPARSGYRPQFYYDGHDWDATHDYGPVEWVFPGQTVTAYLAFLSPACHFGRLDPGKEFLLREGQRTVGHGVVTKLLNLERHAQKRPCDDNVCIARAYCRYAHPALGAEPTSYSSRRRSRRLHRRDLGRATPRRRHSMDRPSGFPSLP